ncbi:hypothetical protein FG386_000850 [Cryptosporidium ryanae]|uniref:uncharacterized protein n=1 Tax=Cryptosporidium ryanae TaxID=515981 RepID=UPI00351A0A8C|nr:hypothetical protein FG386_000850 [Cryptosporidium ryanae]
MYVNVSTNSVEAERCRNLLINQLISSQYWQGSIRSQRIINSVSLFNRFIRLSNQQNNINEVLEALRNEIPDQYVFDEFIRRLESENFANDTTQNSRSHGIVNFFKRKLATLNSELEKIADKIENVTFRKLPETLQRSVIPSYRRPLILLFLLNICIFAIRVTLFNWSPILKLNSKKNYSFQNVTEFYRDDSSSVGYYQTLLEVILEICSFFINISMSIIPLALPILTLHFLYGQNTQR